MPKKLIALLVLLGVSAALNFANASWIMGGLQVLLAGGLFSANDGVRKLMIGICTVGVVLCGFLLAMLIPGVLGGMDPFALLLAAIVVVFGLAQNAYGVWCLTRRDVVSWMLHRGMANLEAKANEPSGF